MKQLELDSVNNSRRKLLFSTLLKTGLLILVVSVSCKNDIEYIQSLSSNQEIPILTSKNFETQYTDSGRLQVILRAPIAERYQKDGEDGDYYEFPEGIEIHFYNKNEEPESILTARYAKYFIEKQLGIGRDSVVGRSLVKGEVLNSEEIFWEQGKKIIYSKVFTKITNEDGVFYGEKGFESDQDFKTYKLIGSSGTVKLEDEELP